MAHVAAVAAELADSIRAFSLATTAPELSPGQRFLGGQAFAMQNLVRHLVDIHTELDDVFPGDARTKVERQRDVVLAQLTTFWLPKLADAAVDVALEAGLSPQDTKDAVFESVDLAFDWAIRQGERAIASVNRAE
jgi:hypothetical protein